MKTKDFHLSRRQMISRQLQGRGIKNKRVLEVMGRVPRHLFVEEALASQSYDDRPLAIGEQQTISQPYIVAQMTEALDLRGKEKVLEVGTGSGYQTSVLAELCHKVCTVERYRSLMVKARKILENLHQFNVLYRVGDGTQGWKEEAPFEAIIVTAGAPSVPQPLIEQLAPLGRLVIPVGESRGAQMLLKIEKTRNGTLTQTELGACRFVDLVGDLGWPDKNNGMFRW